MISNILKAFSKETSDGYIISRSDLPPGIMELLNTLGDPADAPATTQNEETDLPLYISSTRIETDLAQLETIDLTTLQARIRPQQSVAFLALCKALNEAKHDTVARVSALVVDLPLKSGYGYQWVRCQVPLQGDTIETWALDGKNPWKGQPLFPRLLVDNKLVAFPDDLRKAVYLAFLQQRGLKKCPLHKMPRLMLRIAYTQPDYTYAQIADHTQQGKTLDREGHYLTYEAVEKNFKNLGKAGKELFGVKFSPIKHLGKYWEEMGFDVAPIRELA